MTPNDHKIFFPPVENADEDGLLAFGGDLEVQTLLTAYSQGIFPWPLGEQFPLAWFSPDPRGILFLEHFRINRTLQKWLQKSTYTIKENQDFLQIINYCAENPHRQRGKQTWILPEMVNAYQELFRQGHAYCIGVYEQEELVGGLYGVKIKKFISGESMFYLRPNASKVALVALSQYMRKENIPWIDTQMVTDTLKSFGAIEIPRTHYLHLLQQQLSS